ncbi:MAG TPA: hypothetical protein VGU64_01585 [Terriglobales bacterium]|nr:hypothetical protein [Terriglobales bacterium]
MAKSSLTEVGALMRKMTLPCIMLMAASLSVFAQGSRTESDESRMILNLENAWNQAEMSHDAHALDSLLLGWLPRAAHPQVIPPALPH